MKQNCKKAFELYVEQITFNVGFEGALHVCYDVQ